MTQTSRKNCSYIYIYIYIYNCCSPGYEPKLLNVKEGDERNGIRLGKGGRQVSGLRESL